MGFDELVRFVLIYNGALHCILQDRYFRASADYNSESAVHAIIITQNLNFGLDNR